MEKQIQFPYPISGYWAYSPSVNKWKETLGRIHNLGGNKILQFGHRPQRKTEAEIKEHEIFKDCAIDGEHCIEHLKDKLKTLNINNKIRYFYTYQTQENFGDNILVSSLDIQISSAKSDYVFWVLVISASSPKEFPDFQKEDEYDLVLIAGKESDSVSELLQEATVMGLEVYVGMPEAPRNPNQTWEVWQEAKPLFMELLKRILLSYRCRHYTQKSFVGIYQSFETPIQSSPVSSVLELYEDQHSLVHYILPGKKVLVSPYWDARKPDINQNGQTPESVKKGFKEIAQKLVDVIVPQDGRGTGKVGLFWPYQKDKVVPPELHPAVGNVTYGEAYYANTRDFYKVCRDAVTELADQGISVELWANIEAFESGAGIPCGSFTDRQRTTKKRLDKALTFDGGYVSDQISFMWSSYYLCKAGYAKSLEEQIQDDWQRPIIVNAFSWKFDENNGVIVQGYNIVTGRIKFTYYDSAWNIKSEEIQVSNGWISPDFGKKYNQKNNVKRYSERLQEVWVPFAWTDMAPNFWLHIKSINETGKTSNFDFSFTYGLR